MWPTAVNLFHCRALYSVGVTLRHGYPLALMAVALPVDLQIAILAAIAGAGAPIAAFGIEGGLVINERIIAAAPLASRLRRICECEQEDQMPDNEAHHA